MALPNLFSLIGVLLWVGYELLLRRRELTDTVSWRAQRWRWFGVAMIAAGLLVRGWGMRTLGSAYTRTLRTVAHQRTKRLVPFVY